MHIDIFAAAFIHLAIGYFASSLYFKEKNRTLMKLTRIILIILFALCAYGFITYNYFLFGFIIIILLMCEIMYFSREDKNTLIRTFSEEFENIALSTHHTIDRQIAAGMIFLLPLDILLYFYFQNRQYLDFAGSGITQLSYNPISLLAIFFGIYLIPILMGNVYHNICNKNKKEEALAELVGQKSIEYAKNNKGLIDLNEIAIECNITLEKLQKVMKKLKSKNQIQYINKTWVVKKYLMEEE